MEVLKQKIKEIEACKYSTISGLNEGEKAFLPLFLSNKKLIITPTVDSLEIYNEVLTCLDKKVLVLKEKLPQLVLLNEKNSAVFKHYYTVLTTLVEGDYDFLIVTPEVLFQKLPNMDFIKKHTLKLEKNKNYNMQNLLSQLVSMGYIKQDIVYEKGDFAVRGDILDIYPINQNNPIRISFFDDEIEEILELDKDNFKSLTKLQNIDIYCSSFLSLTSEEKDIIASRIQLDLQKLSLKPEAMIRIAEVVSTQIEYLKNDNLGLSSVFFLPYCSYYNYSIFDYLSKDTKIIVDEPKLITDKIKTIEDDNINTFLNLSVSGEFLPKHMDFYFEKKEVLKDLKNFNLIAYSRLISQNKIFESEQVYNFICEHMPKFIGHFVELCEFVNNLKKNRNTVVISTGNDLVKNKLTGFLNERKIKFNEIHNVLESKENEINIIDKPLPFSVYFEMEKFILIGCDRLTAHSLVRQEKTTNKIEKVKFIPKIGEYVVHEVHGVGKCIGVENMKITNISRDYIIIEYKDGDILYVPSENADLLSNFTGEAQPKCNKIGGTEFFKVKQKVKNSIKEMAFDLLQVYSARMKAKGFVYSKDSYLQEAFEAAFPYDYTEDQMTALKQIKSDMESGKIMDRLLCGDVGFGKTEVALAAAYKAIQDGKQVAIICPTTILCEQHFSTALSRMKDFFVRVGVINRFKNKAEQANILKDLKDGKIDLICGTHRLFSNDVKFKDLGLIIIDEEQRFGVEDKEKLKNIKKTVDVLSLSATPIPRTLYMSLVGIRDVSFITTPPKQRKAVKTSVLDYSDNILVDACKKELARDGQVLIVYNRVETITKFYAHVKALLPDAVISFAHGQMTSKALEKEIYNLYSRKTQILISTVLIENGVDLPYANTLFVIDADKLGLSQLYQLRGRIGRSDIEAYAYFSFSRDKTLTMDSYKRLDALMEFSDFGSGYKIAMKDLEIRGAGDVLGRFQHGHMQQVGYDMYVKLLNEAVCELRGEKIEEQREIKINISLSAFVPKNYISKSENCIVFYTKISKIKSIEELNAILEETRNIYGTLPHPVEQLCKVGLIKNLGQKIYAKRIICNEFGARIEFYEDVVSTPINKFLMQTSADFVYNNDKMPIIIFKKEASIEKQQELLLKFLLKCK